MKLLKTLLTGMMVAGFAAAASAQTEVYIVGSTAYRSAVTKAIEDVLAGPSSSGTFSYAWDNGSNANHYKSSSAIYSGTYSGSWTIIHTHWTGSAAGTVDLSVPNAVSFLADTDVMAGMVPTTGSTGYGGGNPLTSPATNNQFPNVAMSDSFASSIGKSIATAPASVPLSATAGTIFQTAINNASLIQAGTLSESVVGLLPFVWVAGAQTTGSCPFSNITQEAASELVQIGNVPISCLVTSTASPVTGDTNDYAFLIGRNEDSGTRIAAQAESQAGDNVGKQPFGNNMKQYYATFSALNGATVASDGAFKTAVAGSTTIFTGGTSTQVSDIGLWLANAPVNTEPALNWNKQGHSGQISGGDVANVLSAQNPLSLNISAIDSGAGQPDNWDGGASGPGNGNATDLINKAYLVGYLGAADASGIPGVLGAALNGNPTAYQLTYNGVPYTPAALQNGSYNFWTFEHMYYTTTNTQNSITKVPAGFLAPRTVVDKICDTLFNGDCQTNSSGVTDSSVTPIPSVGGLKLNNAAYSRLQEGAPIAPLF